jgi:hypothetical protein
VATHDPSCKYYPTLQLRHYVLLVTEHVKQDESHGTADITQDPDFISYPLLQLRQFVAAAPEHDKQEASQARQFQVER